MKFRIEKEVLKKFPNLVVAVPVVLGFDNTKSKNEVLDILRLEETKLRDRFTLESFLNDKRVTIYNDTFKLFGVDPDKRNPAHVALSKRILEGNKLPDINPLVNLYNALSIKYTTPFGGEDLETVYGDFVLKFAKGNERWTPIGGEKGKTMFKGDLIWGDDLDISTPSLNWRQCNRTKLTAESKNGYFIMDGFSDVNKDVIETASEEFCNLMVKFFGGKAVIYWLDSKNPEVEVPFETKKITDDLSTLVVENKPKKTTKTEYFGRFKLIADILSKLVIDENIEVNFSPNEKFGDYSTNVALKNKDLNIDQIIEKVNDQELEFTAEKVGRFINFKLKSDILVDNLIQIDSEKENFGTSDLGKGKLAIIEYSSPNIAKPFGVGHLRSTVIGDAIANLYQAIGYKVMRDNHLGDWGTQFGKVIYAIKKWGDEGEIEKAESPVEELVKLYVKYHDESKVEPKIDDEARLWFKKLEDGDIEAKRLWQKCVDWSWVEFERIYKLLGIEFDKGFNNGRGLGESFFESRMPEVLKELEHKKLLNEGDDGAKLVFFNQEPKLPPLMILKKDGATLYSTRDLATDKYRKEKYDPNIIINEVGSEQNLYFKQLYEIEKILGWYKEGQRVHVGHGLFLLDGKKMSTRAGKTVKLDEVLTEAIERAKKLGKEDISDESARQVGIGAIKYFDLSHQPMTNINFDWEKMFSMDGNSSPYIQYTIARANSVLHKAEFPIPNSQFPMNFQLNNEELLVLRKLSQFHEVIVTAAKNYSPNVLCNYLYELAQKFNTFYNAHRIISDKRSLPTEVSKNDESFRILLTKSTGQVLKNGLKLLGIESPEKM